MPRLIKPLAAMLAPALLAVCMVAAPARAAGVSCEAWNTGGFFEDATAADVSRCLKAGASTSARNKAGLTPLHWAAELSENVEVVKTLLLAAGAEPAARDNAGKTPWHYAEENAALKGTEVYWRLNDGRFR